MTTNNIQIDKPDFFCHIIDKDAQGLRLDIWLARNFSQFSRARWQSAIKCGEVLLNGMIVKTRVILNEGDEVRIQITPQKKIDDIAQYIELEIIHDDDDIIVINKPHGLVVHPAVGNRDGTLLNALLYHYPELSTLPRAGIVHRLDKNTSGLMVVARNLQAHKHLVEQLQRRTMERVYLALVYRHVIGGDTVDMPLGRDKNHRQKIAVRQDGKNAVTHFRIEEHLGATTLLRVKLETGRTHQIRVHLNAINHPIVGDKVYGGRNTIPKGISEQLRATLMAFPRQALHATTLVLNHPENDKKLSFYSALPKDFNDLLTKLRAD